MAFLETDKSAEDLANDEVLISQVAALNDYNLPDPRGIPFGSSVKVSCPFAFLHNDPSAASFRVYATNTAYCFAGCGFFTPTMLAAQLWDLSRDVAAERLLERFKIKPPSWIEQWTEFANKDTNLDHEMLAAAFRIACHAHPGYEPHQYDGPIVDVFVRACSVLPYVTTIEQAREWLARSKATMHRALEEL